MGTDSNSHTWAQTHTHRLDTHSKAQTHRSADSHGHTLADAQAQTRLAELWPAPSCRLGALLGLGLQGRGPKPGPGQRSGSRLLQSRASLVAAGSALGRQGPDPQWAAGRTVLSRSGTGPPGGKKAARLVLQVWEAGREPGQGKRWAQGPAAGGRGQGCPQQPCLALVGSSALSS